MKLIGVDVGFAKTRKSTGIAWLDGDRFDVKCAHTDWEDRSNCIPRGFKAEVLALDGPLLPQGAPEYACRSCEYVFIHAPFHNRCKPGLSHIKGTGLDLRRATADACAQFSSAVGPRCRDVHCDGPIVEAFPNAFLAILLPERVFLNAPKIRRGQRFTWLYENAVCTGTLESALRNLLDLPDVVWNCLSSETNREKRAALVCLLTAALQARGKATKIGNRQGGWFWLPPCSSWQSWAKDGLTHAGQVVANKGHPRLDDWK